MDWKDDANDAWQVRFSLDWTTETTQSKPEAGTHWSRSTMAHEAGISDSSVDRIWRIHA